jgi:hypothetical protein
VFIKGDMGNLCSVPENGSHPPSPAGAACVRASISSLALQGSTQGAISFKDIVVELL